MIGYIYKTTNLINGKIYIGQHKAKQFDDWYKGSGKVLWLAINKYGWDNFKCELLVECNSQEELNSEEKRLIKEYNSKNRLIGYNISDGGEHGYPCLSGEYNPMYGKKMSLESRIKMSEAHKGKKLSEETKRKLSESKRGIPKSEETRKNMSKAQAGRTISESGRKNIALAQKGNKNASGKRSEEICRKMSEAHKGKKLSEETCRKMSQITSHRRWVNNGTENKRVDLDDLQWYLDNGWVQGMIR